MKLKHTLVLTFGLMIMLAFVSCRSGMEPPTAGLLPAKSASVTASQSALELSAVPSLPTETMDKTPTLTVVTPASSPTVIPATATPSPPLPSPTILPATLTPLPTLEGEALETAVAKLLANPMNCDVPCWWGAIPGVTSLDEIKHAVSLYNFDMDEFVDGQFTILTLGIGYIEERNDFEIRIGYVFSNSLLVDVSADSPSISEFLARYGQPDEVWLETMSFERETLPVRLNMVYLQSGVAVGYVVDGDIQGDMVVGCFADEEGGLLHLIEPENVTNYRDFSLIFEDDRRYLSLEEATSLTMEDFMQQFSDPTQPQCIETPIELWD